MPPPEVLFTPDVIIAALDRLTDQEAFELDQYAGQGTREQYCERATVWLLSRGFSGRAVMVVSANGPS